MQAYKEHELYFTGMIPVVIWYMNARSYDELELPQPPFNLLPAKNVRIYIETVIVMVISYVSLLINSWSYIWLVVFPIIAVGFIVALCSELCHQEQSNEGEGEATASWGKKGEGLEAVALVPYWALCVMGQFQAADRFAVSQFLLFFSFMLGALTMMMTRLVGLATTVHRGIAPASVLLRKASLVVLLVAVHAVAAELLGENALLYCLPEILPVLLWLSVRIDRITGTGADRIKQLDLGSRVLNLLGAAAAAVLAAMLAVGYMDESVLYWCGKALVSCAVSALLTWYIVFMLCQWPGAQRDGTLVTVTAAASLLQEAVELLRYWAIVLLAAVAMLLVYTSLSSFQLVIREEPASADQILQRLCQKFLQFII